MSWPPVIRMLTLPGGRRIPVMRKDAFERALRAASLTALPVEPTVVEPAPRRSLWPSWRYLRKTFLIYLMWVLLSAVGFFAVAGIVAIVRAFNG